MVSPANGLDGFILVLYDFWYNDLDRPELAQIVMSQGLRGRAEDLGRVTMCASGTRAPCRVVAQRHGRPGSIPCRRTRGQAASGDGWRVVAGSTGTLAHRQSVT
ncbi:hypothetical protein Ntsu_79430 [Nocardia sp. IFM 10818]